MMRRDSRWESVLLSAVAEINPKGFRKAPADADLVSFIPMSAVEAGSGKLDASDLRPWSEVKRGYTRFEEGDVLFAKITPCMENGKIAHALGLFDGRGVGSTEFHVLRPDPAKVLPEWLLHFLLQQNVRDAARARMGGAVGQQRVPEDFLETVRIPLPSLEEQRSGLAFIQMHLARLHDATDRIGATKRNLPAARASILSAAVGGRLVPTEAELAKAEDRAYEPASMLLERILADRRRRWEDVRSANLTRSGNLAKRVKSRTTYVEPVMPLVDKEEKMPAGWCRATVDQVADNLKYGTSAKCSDDASGIPVIRMGNLVGGGLDTSDLKYLPRDHPDIPDQLLTPGTVLFNRTNSFELVGKSALYTGNPSPCICASYIIRVTVGSGVLPAYLNLSLNSLRGREWVKRVATQQVGQANVNGTKLRAHAFPLPPLAEQRRIVAEVDRRMTVLDAVEATLSASLARCAKLRHAILKRAFEGRSDAPQEALAG